MLTRRSTVFFQEEGNNITDARRDIDNNVLFVFRQKTCEV